MEQSPFKCFLALVHFDATYLHLLRERRQCAQDLADLYDKKNDLLDKKDALVKDVYDAKKEVDALELEMRSLEQKTLAIKNNFSHASGNQEFMALKKESEYLQEQQYNLESRVVAAWNALETAQKNQEITKKDLESQDVVLQEQEDSLRATDALLAEKLATYEGERKELLKTVPEQWLEQYERMKHTVENPVVMIQESSCSTCYACVPPHELAALHRKKVISCPGCFRLLYAAHEEEV